MPHVLSVYPACAVLLFSCSIFPLKSCDRNSKSCSLGAMSICPRVLHVLCCCFYVLFFPLNRATGTANPAAWAPCLSAHGSCMCCAVVFMLYFTFSSNSVTGTTKPAAWAPMLPTHALRAVLQFWWALERGNCWDAS